MRADNIYVREEVAGSEVGTEEFLCLSREQQVGTGFSQVTQYKTNSWPHAVRVKRLGADLMTTKALTEESQGSQ